MIDDLIELVSSVITMKVCSSKSESDDLCDEDFIDEDFIDEDIYDGVVNGELGIDVVYLSVDDDERFSTYDEYDRDHKDELLVTLVKTQT